MKILMAAMRMGIGGAETHILELSSELVRRGHKVTVASAGGEYACELEKNGVRHVRVPMDSRSPLSMLVSLIRLNRLIKRERFDIVHAHARIPALLCDFLRDRLGYRLVTTAHRDFDITPFLRRHTHWGERCFAVSDDLRNYVIREYGYPSENVTVIPNGIDTSVFSPPVKRAPGKRIILHVSRLDSSISLCPSELIKAAPRIHERFPDTELVIVGGGDYLDELSSLAARVNSDAGEEIVKLTGPEKNPVARMKTAFIFAGPSRAALEAMSCGLPCVVTGSQGHLGIFGEDTRGLAVSGNFCSRGLPLPDASVLERDICALLSEDGEKLEARRVYNREFVKKYYSVNEMTDLCESGYNSLYSIKKGSDILLCGYYGCGNKGDEAMLSGIVSGLRRSIPGASLCVMSGNPRETRRKYSTDAVGRFNILSVRKRLSPSSVFLFGGGNLLQDKTSTQSLLYYLFMLRLAKRRGADVYITSNGIGPLGKKRNLRRAAKALSGIEYVSLREEYSFKAAKALGAVSPVLTFDSAVTFAPDGGGVSLPEKKFFAVCPKKLGSSAEHLISAVSAVRDSTGLEPVFICMDESKDGKLCRALASAVGGKTVSVSGAPGLVYLLSHAEFSVCSRLHALILSVAASCPAAAYTDDIKLTAFMEYIGMKELVSYPDEGEGLLLSLTRLASEKESFKKRLTESLPEYKALADGESDRLAGLISAKHPEFIG